MDDSPIKTPHAPTIAPGIEMDELDEKATAKEVAEGESTTVTRLALDRVAPDAGPEEDVR